MPVYVEPLAKLIESLRALPGIGPKSAQRLALHILAMPAEEVHRFARSLTDARSRIRYCSACGNYTVEDPCRICSDPRRDAALICVVQDVRDILTIENAGDFRGLYHVLHGALSPIEGIGPDQLRIDSLIERLRSGGVREVILATNPNVEGDATAMFLARLIRPLGVKTTRIAFGLPVGGDLEYADSLTISRALEGRREIE